MQYFFLIKLRKLSLYSSSATYPNQLQSPARSGQARSIQITHCLAARVPSMPNQSPAIDSFNVLHRTPGLCVCLCVCAWKRKVLREHRSQSYIILRGAIIEHCGKKYGDSASLFVLIDTNEQGLAEVVLAVCRLGEWDGAIGWAGLKV